MVQTYSTAASTQSRQKAQDIRPTATVITITTAIAASLSGITRTFVFINFILLNQSHKLDQTFCHYLYAG
jgi:hypothetical protein